MVSTWLGRGKHFSQLADKENFEQGTKQVEDDGTKPSKEALDQVVKQRVQGDVDKSNRRIIE